MSRPLLPTPADAHLNMMHKSTDGSEMNAGDIPLPVGAGPFTSAATIEQWLEALQSQLNTLSNATAPNPFMLRLGVKQ